MAAPSLAVFPAIFAGLDKSAIADMMSATVLRRFPSGHIIIHADEPGTQFFLIRISNVDFYRLSPQGQQILIMRFASGDARGIVSLPLRSIGYIGTAEAVGETEIYVWDRQDAHYFAQKYPKFKDNALRIACEYTKLYSDRHLSTVTDDAGDRLRRTLLQLGNRIGHRTTKGIEVAFTNERLASRADISYFTVNRLLNKWIRKGAIEKTRSAIVILHPEGMLDAERPHRILHKLKSSA